MMTHALTSKQRASLQHAGETPYVSGARALEHGPEARLLALGYVRAAPRFPGSLLYTVSITAAGRAALAKLEAD